MEKKKEDKQEVAVVSKKVKKVGRPRKTIEFNDETIVSKLAEQGMSARQIAKILSSDKNFIHYRFGTLIKQKQVNAKKKLLGLMWAKAEEGDTKMMIFLAKNILGMTDKVDLQVDVEHVQKPQKPLIIQVQQDIEKIS